MVTQSILLTLVLGSAPSYFETPDAGEPIYSPLPPEPHGALGDTTQPPEFAELVASIDVTRSDEDAVIQAFDDAGQQIASLAIWVDSDRITWLAADYADGYSLVGVDPDRSVIVHSEQSLAAIVLARRASVIEMFADPAHPAADNSWGECAWKAAGTVGACALARPFGCVFGAVKAACACVPMVVKEFKEYECPWDL